MACHRFCSLHHHRKIADRIIGLAFSQYWRMAAFLFITCSQFLLYPQLGKYIPGSIWHFAARINAYKENALSNKKTAQAMLIENIWLVTGAAAFGVIFLVPQSHRDGRVHPPISAAPRMALESAAVSGFDFLDRQVCSFWTNVTRPAATGSQFPGCCLLITGPVRNLALFRYQLLSALPERRQRITCFLILGGYALSWIAGYVVIFAPGGIGVRESVQVFLFSSISTPQQIVIISLMHRMVYTIIEVILGLVGYLLTKRVTRNQNSIPG